MKLLCALLTVLLFGCCGSRSSLPSAKCSIPDSLGGSCPWIHMRGEVGMSNAGYVFRTGNWYVRLGSDKAFEQYVRCDVDIELRLNVDSVERVPDDQIAEEMWEHAGSDVLVGPSGPTGPEASSSVEIGEGSLMVPNPGGLRKNDRLFVALEVGTITIRIRRTTEHHY